jgi:hypothetical protein
MHNWLKAVQWFKSLVQAPADLPAPAAEPPLIADTQQLHDRSSVSSVASPVALVEVLDHVFTYVGGGEHLYVAGVSNEWRCRYMQHCVQNGRFRYNGKRATRYRSVLMTESRLELAVAAGFKVTTCCSDS